MPRYWCHERGRYIDVDVVYGGGPLPWQRGIQFGWSARTETPDGDEAPPPTLKPVAPPTLKPVAPPTLKPVAPPTLKPVGTQTERTIAAMKQGSRTTAEIVSATGIPHGSVSALLSLLAQEGRVVKAGTASSAPQGGRRPFIWRLAWLRDGHAR